MCLLENAGPEAKRVGGLAERLAEGTEVGQARYTEMYTTPHTPHTP